MGSAWTGSPAVNCAITTDIEDLDVGKHQLTVTATDDEGLSRAVQMVLFGRGPVLCDIKVTRNASPLVMPPREGVALKNRFREALLGPDALKE